MRLIEENYGSLVYSKNNLSDVRFCYDNSVAVKELGYTDDSGNNYYNLYYEAYDRLINKKHLSLNALTRAI